jgi:tellurite resistance protein TehA-like permease
MKKIELSFLKKIAIVLWLYGIKVFSIAYITLESISDRLALNMATAAIIFAFAGTILSSIFYGKPYGDILSAIGVLLGGISFMNALIHLKKEREVKRRRKAIRIVP